MIKFLENIRIQGAYLNLIKVVCNSPTDKVMLSREKLKSKEYPGPNQRSLPSSEEWWMSS